MTAPSPHPVASTPAMGNVRLRSHLLPRSQAGNPNTSGGYSCAARARPPLVVMAQLAAGVLPDARRFFRGAV